MGLISRVSSRTYRINYHSDDNSTKTSTKKKRRKFKKKPNQNASSQIKSPTRKRRKRSHQQLLQRRLRRLLRIFISQCLTSRRYPPLRLHPNPTSRRSQRLACHVNRHFNYRLGLAIHLPKRTKQFEEQDC